ncbi:MAG: imelysin family protein [Flavobacteriaceae bacterium]|nr:imelysin family protein [Flavobacteriaceae bacterium]
MKKLFSTILIIFVFSCVKESSSDTTVKLVDATPTNTNNTSNTSDNSDTSDASDTTDSSETFDRSGMLVNWADNIIIPSYNEFKSSLSKLNEAINAFNNKTDNDNLILVRDKWLIAYKSWQHIEMITIGKAKETYYQSKMNVYPSDIDRIERNISSEFYDLTNANENDSQGFPALDYMLFAIADSDEQILEKFSESNKKYSNYLTALINEMMSNTNTVVDDWNTFRDNFITSTENTATSSINKVTNDFIYYYEKGFRATKFGIPAGVFSGSKLPDRVEAYYSKKFSRELALEALLAIENFFTGKEFDGEKIGGSLSSYLVFLNTEKNGTSLSKSITDQFAVAREKIKSLDENFVSQIQSDNNSMLLTYDEIQKGVVMLKTDMLQSLGINVDYVDADGD